MGKASRKKGSTGVAGAVAQEVAAKPAKGVARVTFDEDAGAGDAGPTTTDTATLQKEIQNMFKGLDLAGLRRQYCFGDSQDGGSTSSRNQESGARGGREESAATPKDDSGPAATAMKKKKKESQAVVADGGAVEGAAKSDDFRKSKKRGREEGPDAGQDSRGDADSVAAASKTETNESRKSKRRKKNVGEEDCGKSQNAGVAGLAASKKKNARMSGEEDPKRRGEPAQEKCAAGKANASSPPTAGQAKLAAFLSSLKQRQGVASASAGDSAGSTSVAGSATSQASAATPQDGSASGGKLRERLVGSRFRELNEDLYTGTGDVALKRFSKQPSLFTQYHDGFRYQAAQWPENPVDLVIEFLRKHFSIAGGKKKKSAVAAAHGHASAAGSTSGVESVDGAIQIADLGCGEAKIASMLNGQSAPALLSSADSKSSSAPRPPPSALRPVRVRSFDLVGNAEKGIVAANINDKVPGLESGSCDAVVLCLALMGKDCAGAVKEAWRLLKPRTGVLIVAEVSSRFESKAAFATQVCSNFGFSAFDAGKASAQRTASLDIENSHFFTCVFRKKDMGAKEHRRLKGILDAKACLYKRR